MARLTELSGRNAVVTGAASGIGRALALRAAEEGMAVALADVDEAGLEETRKLVEQAGANVIAVPTDVSKSDSVEALAAAVDARLGDPHLVFNNAGVLISGRAWERSEADWDWVLGVNLRGVIHGMRAFVPRMLSHGEPAHMVNTASVGGLVVGPFLAPYIVSKHAVVALTESLHYELAAEGASIGVSALCPGAVATGITASERIRPQDIEPASPLRSAGEKAFAEGLSGAIGAGMSPSELAGHAFAGVKEGRFWILPDPSYKPGLETRMRSILDELNPLQSIGADETAS
jgi:NAD(P)-dependent dehydrogenase (short-subunit alcohol dehydrogenase family)